MSGRRGVGFGFWALVALVGYSSAGSAHPHVWVNVATTVVYENGKVTGFRHHWTFDDMYTEMAIQGLDKNGDGDYSREELAELTQTNIDGLKEFEYFTFAKLGDMALPLAPPKDYWLEYKDKVLALNFTLPLAEAVPAEAQGLKFSVYDESFFIAFDLAKVDPIKVSSGAPAGCTAELAAPDKDLEQLSQAFGGPMTAGDANANTGGAYAREIKVGCQKS